MSALVMTVAPRIHRQYEHVSPWWKSLGGVSLSPRGIRRFFLIRWEAHRKRITAVSSTFEINGGKVFHYIDRSIPRCLRLK
jgi:hypothetical protein